MVFTIGVPSRYFIKSTLGAPLSSKITRFSLPSSAKKRLFLGGFLSIFLSVFFLPAAQANEIKLQWFDADGQSVDVNWRRSSQWEWKEQHSPTGLSLSPTLTIWVQLPSHIHVAESPDPRVRILYSPREDDQSEEEILVVETTTPTFTAKLNLSNNSESEESTTSAGLLIAVDFSVPPILTHESCTKEGISVKRAPPQKADSKLFYLGASCRRNKKIIDVDFHLPADTSLKSAMGQPLPSHRLSLSLERPDDVREPEGSQRTLLGFRVVTKGAAEFQNYKIVFKGKDSPEPKAAKDVQVSQDALNRREIPKEDFIPGNAMRRAKKEPKKESASVKTTRYSLGFSPTYIGYTNPPGAPFSPGEYFLEAALKLQSTARFGETFHFPWEVELKLPLIPLLPQPFRFPQSGSYSLSPLAQIGATFRAGSFLYRFLAGAVYEGIYLRERSDFPHFALGPNFKFVLSNEQNKVFGGRAFDFHAGVAPLHGIGRQNFFNGFLMFSAFYLEASRLLSGERLDIETKFEYQNLTASSGSTIHVKKMSLGLVLWF